MLCMGNALESIRFLTGLGYSIIILFIMQFVGFCFILGTEGMPIRSLYNLLT